MFAVADCVDSELVMDHNYYSVHEYVDFPVYWSNQMSVMSAKIEVPLQCDSRTFTLEEILQSRTTKSTYSHKHIQGFDGMGF